MLCIFLVKTQIVNIEGGGAWFSASPRIKIFVILLQINIQSCNNPKQSEAKR